MVAIPLNFYKGFMLFTLMYILFLGLAISGYQSWKKEKIKTN
jgi:nicotinamide riboside transporter PnuC